MRQYLENACEEVDASIFTGDVLYCDEERKVLKEYVERWLRAITAHESLPLEEDEQSKSS